MQFCYLNVCYFLLFKLGLILEIKYNKKSIGHVLYFYFSTSVEIKLLFLSEWSPRQIIIIFYLFDVYDPIQGLKKPLPIDKYQPSKIIWGTEPDVSKRTHLLKARALLAVSNEHYAQNEITVDIVTQWKWNT